MSISTTNNITGDCDICGDEQFSVGLVTPGCRHKWCRKCIITAFRKALQCERAYPPRCCFVIPIEKVQWLLDKDFIRQYLEKRKEYECPRAERLYCAKKSCSSWIGSKHRLRESQSGFCGACKSLTCPECKGLIMPGSQNHVCQKDHAEQMLLEQVKEKHLQRCYSCGFFVELVEACNHVVCSECNAHFCFVCAKPWAGKHECPKYNQPEYDEDGYNQEGYHRDTQLDRSGRDFRGFDAEGFDAEGFDRQGYHRHTRLDRNGRDFQGFDAEGYDREGYHRDTGLDREGKPSPYSIYKALQTRIAAPWENLMHGRPLPAAFETQRRPFRRLRGGGEERDSFEGDNERFDRAPRQPAPPMDLNIQHTQQATLNAQRPASTRPQNVAGALSRAGFGHLPPMDEQRRVQRARFGHHPPMDEQRRVHIPTFGFDAWPSMPAYPDLRATQQVELPPPLPISATGAFQYRPGFLPPEHLVRAGQQAMIARNMAQQNLGESRRLQTETHWGNQWVWGAFR